MIHLKDNPRRVVGMPKVAYKHAPSDSEGFLATREGFSIMELNCIKY
jgi:hypothetical protein